MDTSGRNRLRAIAYAAIAALMSMSALAGAQLPRGTHAFSLEDAAQRTEVQAAVMSPAGESFAIQVTRPLADAGIHAGATRSAVQPRGSIWLFDSNLANPRMLPAENLWTWAPVYSPSGRKLAALFSDTDGRVGLIVWDLVKGDSRRWSQVEVDVHAALRIHAAPDLNQAGWMLETRPFVWSDEDTVLFVDRNGALQQWGLAPATATATQSALRDRTRSGQLSVRVWNEHSPTEGAANRLMTLDVTSGRTVVHYEGDVRGASLSPDRTHAALLVATRHLDPVAGPMEAPLQAIHQLDDRVGISLVIQSLVTPGPGRPAPGVRVTGPVDPSRLPLWSDEGRRVALAGRESYSGGWSSRDDAAWQVSTETLEVRRVQASSALDAQLIANILTGDEQRADHAIEYRPALEPANDRLSMGQVPGRIWRFGADNYLIWLEQRVQIMSPAGVVTLPGDYSFVQAGDIGITAPRFVLVRGGQSYDLRFSGHEPVITPLENPAQGQILSAGGAAGGLTLYKLDGREGTSLHLLRDNVAARSVTPFNQHLRSVAAPSTREIRLEIGGRQLTGILQLPPGRRSTDRHPVVVTAYPDYLPRLNDSSHRINSSYSALFYPFQYFLGRGFAVFTVPFPVARAENTPPPLELAVEAVTPWLALLDQQPDVLAGEYAFWGHSNSGYVGLALATRTSAFRAIAVSSSFPDLHWMMEASLELTTLESGGEILQARRAVYEYETQPYAFGSPPWDSQDEWIRNSPAFNLGNVTTPMLLLVGEFDFAPRSMERVYSVLRGRGVPVEMAQYWGESHVIASPGNLFDTWTRSDGFFRRYLRME